MTDDRDHDQPQVKVAPLRNAEIVALLRCSRCNLPYSPSKSTSALRLTYCSFLCELGDLGFSIVGLEHMERSGRGGGDATPAETPEPVATP